MRNEIEIKQELEKLNKINLEEVGLQEVWIIAQCKEMLEWILESEDVDAPSLYLGQENY